MAKHTSIRIVPFGRAMATYIKLNRGDFGEALKALRPLRPSKVADGWVLDHDDIVDLAPRDGYEAVYAVVDRVLPKDLSIEVLKADGGIIR